MMSALYGAMLAGVDVVLMGAGIPRQFRAFRCSAEPVEPYASKGGEVGRTVGPSCLCNS
jgi:NAD(P)H-dependent flavin oxidoreductase YrpB (nitropropane dioxygenase family)